MKVNAKSRARRVLLIAAAAVLIFVVIVSVYVLYGWDVFRSERDSKYVMQYYYEPENSLDGVVLGSSAAYRYCGVRRRHLTGMVWRFTATGFEACRYSQINTISTAS